MGISDVIIQNTSGIPYLARCYGGDFCQNNTSHTLITGFFAAIYTFKGEFNQEKLRIIGFDKLSLIIEVQDEFMVILGVEDIEDISEKTIRKLAKEITREFIDRYQDIIKSTRSIDLRLFDDFVQIMDDLVDKKSLSEFVDLMTTKPNIWSRIKTKIF